MGKMTAGAAASVPWRVQRVRLSNGQTVPVIVKNDSHMFSDTGGNRGKGNDSGSSKGSPNTSHVDSKKTGKPQNVESGSSSTSPKVGASKPQNTWVPKDSPSESTKPKTRNHHEYDDPHLNQQSISKLSS
ncbi:hypothetical protein [Paenibacillus sp. FSL K6-0108]|uniref:hypothetical protein n=1 Tax=Paenibacillus sp. FSL K6-0108 TaxID=2921417 RepID=UPI003246AE0F